VDDPPDTINNFFKKTKKKERKKEKERGIGIISVLA
jgi:hypothetical protein